MAEYPQNICTFGVVSHTPFLIVHSRGGILCAQQGRVQRGAQGARASPLAWPQHPESVYNLYIYTSISLLLTLTFDDLLSSLMTYSVRLYL